MVHMDANEVDKRIAASLRRIADDNDQSLSYKLREEADRLDPTELNEEDSVLLMWTGEDVRCLMPGEWGISREGEYVYWRGPLATQENHRPLRHIVIRPTQMQQVLAIVEENDDE